MNKLDKHIGWLITVPVTLFVFVMPGIAVGLPAWILISGFLLLTLMNIGIQFMLNSKKHDTFI